MAKNSGRNRKSSGPSRKPAKKPFWRRLLRGTVLWGFALALLGAIFLGVAIFFTERELPDYSALKSSQNGQMIVVRARDGSELVSLGPSYGKWLPADQIPAIMKKAMVAVEDRRFYSHFGVDPLGLLRAVYTAVSGDRRISATSTITQQLARNIFLNNSRSYVRKAREAVIALALERKFTKDQILELYLNKVYFGGGAYGIDAASRKFFGHPATELSTAEAAIIAGLVKAPSHYSPTADAEASVERGKVVLGLMAKNGAITPAEAGTIDLSDVNIAKEKGQNSVRYFTDWALPQLDLLLPETNGPIEVWTTLDPKMQAAATRAIDANVPDGAQGALVSLDNDGAVLAMVGGTDYVTSNYNRATDAVRQPGSAWKLFVYMAALEAGYTPSDRVVDEPVTIDGWSPHNSGRNYAGEIDVRTAFAYSKNTIAAQLGNEVGFGTVASMARRFGITTPINTQPAMVLGTSEVRVIDMTRAFAAVSAGGTSVEPYGITKVTASDGEVLYQHKSVRGQVLVPHYVAAGITDLLQTAVATGTGRAAQIGRPVAGKTGTTSSNKDGWFLGFSSGVTTGVWMGRDDAKRVGGLSGGHAPARAFADYMKVAVAKRPVEEFDTKLQLPEWQLEPDDEYLQGDPDDYYYVDENGNLVPPGDGTRPAGDLPRYEDGTVGPGPGPGTPQVPDYGPPAAPPAASDDFLDQATGKKGAAADPGLRPGQGIAPSPTPTRTPAGAY
ncbi:PBP1A family penicillin-binding protein [Novosphingobium mangrovi (ex Huang et al. 2023)]|uniref:peptidoglycan glycosyltransferase n=1 Tax=Novosphingobium mangrovi (ex Huang et al. 2023) TaxID=2976432 RepID=A0ABT2I8H1_9SPHN|nr:PBP1A family penicillin-binding protein [Novosphingobium mangrovi (ex Huang et al. 2023)]MCT2401109.1 PBP1A family penicillin-binding protein [Novosphingobium mangrovi (ex Huang et al. 2023)]